MTRLPALLFVCLSAVAAPVLGGQANVVAPDVDALRQRELLRVKLLTTGDYDALAKMTSPTLTYSHSGGALDTKDTWLGNLRSGQVAFQTIAHGDIAVRFLAPDVALLNSLADVEVKVGGQLQKMKLRLTIVYVRKGADWIFEAWHASRLPDQP